MVLSICSICGNPIYEPPRGTPKYQEAEQEYKKAHPNGYFDIEYRRAYTDPKTHEIVQLAFDPDWACCPECREIANQAIMLAFENILRNKKKTVKVETGKFPPNPILLPDYSDRAEPFG